MKLKDILLAIILLAVAILFPKTALAIVGVSILFIIIQIFQFFLEVGRVFIDEFERISNKKRDDMKKHYREYE